MSQASVLPVSHMISELGSHVTAISRQQNETGGAGVLMNGSLLSTCVTTSISLPLFVKFGFIQFLTVCCKSWAFCSENLVPSRGYRFLKMYSINECFAWQICLREISLLKHGFLSFQLHDHEDVLESGAHGAADVQQDQSDDRETTWGPT